MPCQTSVFRCSYGKPRGMSHGSYGDAIGKRGGSRETSADTRRDFGVEFAHMQRRTFLATGSMAAVGFGADGVRHRRNRAESRAPTRRPCAGAGQRVLGSHHPHDGRPAPASRRRLRAPGRQTRRQAAGPQLRPRRRRHVAGVGHRPDGRGFATAHQERHAAVIGCGVGRPDLRAPAAAARLRRDDLRAGGTARRDLEHVARRVYADVGPGRRPNAARRRGTRSTAAPRTSPTGSCSCSSDRTSASRGSTTSR